MLNRSSQVVISALLALSLSSCGGMTSVKPDMPAPISNSEARAKPSANANSTTQTQINAPQNLVTLAQRKAAPERERLLLEAADIYIQQGSLDKARNLVNSINTTQLSEPNFVAYSQVSAKIALKEGDVARARRILTNPRLEQQLKALEPQQEAAVRELRAQTYDRNGELPASIAERINASAVLTEVQAATANQETLWQTLLLLPLNDLQANARKGSGGITQGWYSLAALSKYNTQDPSAQLTALTQWQQQWRNHPAALNLPKDLHALQAAVKQRPKKIALLVPMQGRLAEAGIAVSDGFFAAYYQQLGNANVPTIQRYDSSQDTVGAYQQAVKDGADLIIGPVDKDGVNKLSHLPDLPVALLSLTYPDQQPAKALANFYQFGLAVEDEGRQAARQAMQDGHTRALVVTTTQDVSERSTKAFTAEFQKLGGVIIGTTSFSTLDKFSEAVGSIMPPSKSQTSESASPSLTTMSDTNQADSNIVFMAVTPAQGRQIKSVLAFQYANNIPVYATSSVYSGDTDAVNNEDLNGVLFNTLPWIFDATNPIKQAIAQTSKSAAVYGRLHALGADAFHLQARLAQLKQAPTMKIYGATGALQLMPDGRIEREQMWARFNKGIAEPLASLVDASPQAASE